MIIDGFFNTLGLRHECLSLVLLFIISRRTRMASLLDALMAEDVQSLLGFEDTFHHFILHDTMICFGLS